MRLEYLRYLLEVDRYHSISAAAWELYISQPALSSIVKSLEKEFGFPIFQRAHNGVVTTPEGEEAISLIWDILSRYDEIKALGQSAPADTQPVHLLGSPTVNCALAMPLSRAVLREEPAGNLVFHEVTGSDVGGKILNNEFTIGLTYFKDATYREFLMSAAKYQIQVTHLFRDHLYLVMRRDHPLAELPSVDVSLVKGADVALLSHFVTQMSSPAFVDRLQRDNRYTTFTNVPLIKRAVLEQNMLSIMCGYAAWYDSSADPTQFHAALLTGLSEENIQDLYLIHQEDRNLRYMEKAVLRCVERYFADLPLPPFSPERGGAEP